MKTFSRALISFTKEPLLHFVLLGALIFWAFDRISVGNDRDQTAIVVTSFTIENLANVFSRTWQRPPSEAELQGLIQDYIREEIAVREALALGLDRDDSIMRRLLRQKLEFVTEEAASQTEPTDAQLQQYLQAHSDLFSSEARISFSQIYFKPQQQRAEQEADITALRDRLNADSKQTDTAELGDITSLGYAFDDVPIGEIERLFGEQFAGVLSALDREKWDGPLKSGYGQHLVKIARYAPGVIPKLAEVRDDVRREWLNDQRANALDQFYTQRLQHYSVKIDMPANQGAIPHLAEWAP